MADARWWTKLHSSRVAQQVGRFGIVGGLGFALDVGAYNLLVFGLRGPDPGPVTDWPLVAKAISVAVATGFTWIGNRVWTFAGGDRRRVHQEAIVFALISLGGLLIALGSLGFSRYVLGLDSQLADNVSANVVGFGLATVFRFWGYRTLVFRAV